MVLSANKQTLLSANSDTNTLNPGTVEEMSRRSEQQGLQMNSVLCFAFPLLLVGFRKNRQGNRRHVGNDAWLRGEVVSFGAEKRVGFDCVPAPVHKAQAGAHNYQNLVVVPESLELAHGHGSLAACVIKES